MSNLTAEKIPAQDFTGTGLEKNLIIVEAAGKEINNTLMIGSANDDDLYYAKTGDNDNIYLITKNEREKIYKKVADVIVNVEGKSLEKIVREIAKKSL